MTLVSKNCYLNGKKISHRQALIEIDRRGATHHHVDYQSPLGYPLKDLIINNPFRQFGGKINAVQQ